MLRVGIDIGGTFTDCIAVDDASGEIWSAKIHTTYPDPSEGFMNGLRTLLTSRARTPDDAGLLIHGTTLVSNALIARKGGKTGLLATAGFGDILWRRDERRYDLFDVMIEFPEPLVPRHHVVEVPERIWADGRVLVPLDEAAVEAETERLVQDGVESVAVCLLHSYGNAAHETRVAALLRQRWPNLRVSLSSDVWPDSGEYLRTSTTVANAYVRTITEDYLDRLGGALEREGFTGRFYLMLSNGGTASLDTGRRYPVQLVESGPAAGALAAAFLAKEAGIRDVVAFDMGGTTAKLSLIENGAPLKKDAVEVARLKRHLPGSGVPLKVPVLDLLEIGSGGGSIASIDDLGLLKVGPQSAGSSPGPACYGWGGEEPTVTDADLILGYLNTEYFLGGQMKLDKEAAAAAIARRVAEPAGMSLLEAAWGIHEVANQSMALAARMHVVERGKDPTRYALVAYGGAGPVHAYGVARHLGVSRIVVPPSAGVAASLGFLVAPIAFDLLRFLRMPLPRADWSVVAREYAEMQEAGTRILADAGVGKVDVHVDRTADMRFIGQGYEVNVTLPPGPLDAGLTPALLGAFRRAYEERYNHLPSQDDDVEFVRLRATAWTPVKPPRLPRNGDRAHAATPVAERDAYFGREAGFVKTAVYRWSAFPADVRVAGPAIIEGVDTTVIVGPGSSVSADATGYVTIVMEGGPR